MGGTLASLGRLREISAVVVRHGLGHFVDARRTQRGSAESEPGTHRLEPAVRFRHVLEELGPTFIKFGQILSTRGDLLPPGFAEALSNLQDNCPPMPFAAAREEVERALGAPIEELYASFDEQPVASASIAQVHRAVTHDGKVVAVKVRRNNIRQKIEQDLDLLHFLARLCESIIAESGLVTPRAVVDEFEHALLSELDFGREARMLQRFRRNAADPGRTYVVPEMYPALSGASVLTMDFMLGRPLSEVGPGPEGQRVAQRMVRACFDQLFVDGLFHADPHPGNCFVLPDGRLGLIDLGAVGEISFAMRETLVVLVLSIGTKDADAIARLLYRVGIPKQRVNLHQLRDACASLLNERLRDRETFIQSDAAGILQALFELAAQFGVRVPSEYALIGRAAMTVEGILRRIDPTFGVIDEARPMLRELIEEQFSLQELGQGALRNLLRARDVVRELPISVSQIVMDLEQGKLRVQIENPHLGAIARTIDTLGVVLFMGLVAQGLVTGALVMLAASPKSWAQGPWVPVAALFVASMLFGTALGRYLLAPHLRKVSISRFILRRRGR
jgi:ubiquinone biosynthesis protein